MIEHDIIRETTSVCPECLKAIPAFVVRRGANVFMEKSCPEHGDFATILWRGTPLIEEWGVPNIPAYPEQPFTAQNQGCPFDCGLCPQHEQHPCCVLLEVSQRCNLGCPTCYASAGRGTLADDPDLSKIAFWYDRLLEACGPFNIQLSGGEPTMRDDLPQIIQLGREKGFSFFQLNTNGIRIAEDDGYIDRLVAAGLSTVYLQFDGTRDDIYRKIRGRDLAALKFKAIERCKSAQIGVVLVPTVIPGVNDDNLGEIIRYGLDNMPTIRCVHIQPVCYMGRYEKQPDDAQRITIPEVFAKIEAQTEGLIKSEWFKPGGGQHPQCGFQANFVLMEDASLYPLSKFTPNKAEGSCCCKPMPADENRKRAQSFVAKTWQFPAKKINKDSLRFGAWDDFLDRKQTHQFTISGMAFQDAWNLDLARLKGCYIMIVSPEGNLVPFCAYNLTNRSGRGLYRKIQQ